MYNVLFIDDITLICNDYAEQIRSLGYKADLAYGQSQAIKLISSNYYDILFTDQKLEDGDGLAILKIALE